jgi:type I restriction enzyme S subunit
MKQKTKFKDTEIGKIPEDWKVKRLGDCLDIVKKQFKPTKGDIRKYIGLEHIEQQSLKLIRIGSSADVGSNKFEFKKDQILFGKLRPYFRKVYQPNFDGVCSTDMWVIGTEEGNDNSFFFYFLADERIINEANNSSEGTRMPRARWDYLEKLKYPIPSLNEQHAIAKILSDFDSKIELLQKQNKTLEAMGQALFKHWFVDFEFPNEEGKPYKSSGGEMVDSELGEIPKGWEVKNLGEFLNVIKGCPYKSDDLKESDKALITLKSINRDGGFNQKGYKEYVGDYKEEQIVKDGDIVVAQTDLTQAAEVIGTPAIVNSLNRYNELIASLDLQILRIKEKLNKGFAYFLLKTAMFHNHALSYTNGTTVLHLNKNAVPDFKFTLPNENILGKFGKIAEQILEKGDKNEKEVYILSQIRDSLLPKLMSGKIRVLNNQKIKEAV